MRVALCNPTYWPEVRRGSERVMHDLGARLTARGHEVTILTSHEAPASTVVEDGVRVIRARRPPYLHQLRHYEDFVQNAPNVFARLVAGRYDVVQTFFPVDAWAAAKARRFGGPPLVLTLHGAPMRHHLVRRRYRLEMFQAGVAAASEVTVLSEFMARYVRRYFQVDPRILPPGINLARFPLAEEGPGEPTLLCPADVNDPRKRGPLLLEAFARLRERRPDARLKIASGGRDQPEAADQPGVEVVRCDDTESLAGAYGGAWATILPSIEEAFGLVLIESLATGRPVVAARSGASPELITDPRLGVLFEPDDPNALAGAMDAVLDLPHDAESVAARRDKAGEFDWELVADLYEEAYEAAASGSRPRLVTGNPGSAP